MIGIKEYLSLTDQFARERALQQGHNEKAADRYNLAGLYAAEAAIRLREEYPDAARVAFRPTREWDGMRTTIAWILGPNGEELYVEDDERFDYYEDQSEPGDNLAAAFEHDAGFFEQAGGLYVYELPNI